jgi:hypothetical protein
MIGVDDFRVDEQRSALLFLRKYHAVTMSFQMTAFLWAGNKISLKTISVIKFLVPSLKCMQLVLSQCNVSRG